MKICKLILFTYFLFITIKRTVQSPSIVIKIIPDAYLNATAAFASFEDNQDSDYLYFSYDFIYHNKVNPKELDKVYFKLTTDYLFSNRDLRYIILDKKQEEVTSEDLDPKNNILWKQCFLLNTLKTNNEYNYYINVHRISAEKNAKNTIIFRFPVVKNNKGQIEIENLYSFPEEILEKKNLNQNFNSWPKINDKDMNMNMNRDYYKNPEPIEPNHINKNYNHHHYHQKRLFKYLLHHRHCSYFSFILGTIFTQIWMVLFVLYFIVNRRKKSHLAIVINNVQNN